MARHRGVGRRAPRHRARKALVFALCAFASGAAHAAVKLQASGETSVGVTDNAQSAPDVPLPGGSSKSAGVFLVLRPGLSLAVLSARTVQRLAYTFDYNLFFTRSTTSSSANRLEYRGFFDLSSRVNA
ncbi:MAG TPA: hypothetical protein VGQ57_19470, partial [Polyangiaceae bacterium]|nr:hypothetical protein [Polyangiaceae bacterium]